MPRILFVFLCRVTTHTAGDRGGCLCAAACADRPRIAGESTGGMVPCFGVHPWYVNDADPAFIAFEPDARLARYPQTAVGESGSDAAERYAATPHRQELLLRVHLGAAFRHSRRPVQLHGVRAW